MPGQGVNDPGADSFPVLNVSFTACGLVGDPLLFCNAGSLFSLGLTAHLFGCFLRLALLFCDGSLLFALCTLCGFTLFTFSALLGLNPLPLSCFGPGLFLCFTAHCSLKLCAVLSFRIAFCLFSCFTLELLFMLTLGLLCLAALFLAFAVELLIHEQGDFVVIFYLNT
ncbi:hypothetical protein ABW09_24745 [Pluralibacter gergoviae]|nr:hypothetical protein ABW09_24745 [Pluralibacter gergoviae]